MLFLPQVNKEYFMYLLTLKKEMNSDIWFSFVNKTIQKEGSETVKLTYPESVFLKCLIDAKLNNETLVEKSYIEQEIWGVTEGVSRTANLTQLVCTLRSKILTLYQEDHLIVTQPRKGYSLHEEIVISLKSNDSSVLASEHTVEPIKEKKEKTNKPKKIFPWIKNKSKSPLTPCFILTLIFFIYIIFTYSSYRSDLVFINANIKTPSFNNKSFKYPTYLFKDLKGYHLTCTNTKSLSVSYTFAHSYDLNKILNRGCS